MYEYDPRGFHHGPGVFGWLMLAALVALLIVGVIALVRAWASPRWRTAFGPIGVAHRPSMDPALAELRVRYARGDITWDEFSVRSGNLGYPVPPGAGGGSPPAAQPPGASPERP